MPPIGRSPSGQASVTVTSEGFGKSKRHLAEMALEPSKIVPLLVPKLLSNWWGGLFTFLFRHRSASTLTALLERRSGLAVVPPPLPKLSAGNAEHRGCVIEYPGVPKPSSRRHFLGLMRLGRRLSTRHKRDRSKSRLCATTLTTGCLMRESVCDVAAIRRPDDLALRIRLNA
jgi:hypothetical protein